MLNEGGRDARRSVRGAGGAPRACVLPVACDPGDGVVPDLIRTGAIHVAIHGARSRGDFANRAKRVELAGTARVVIKL